MTNNPIDAAVERKRQAVATAQAAQAAAAAAAIKAKHDEEHACIRAWLEQQPLWAELQAHAAAVVTKDDQRAIIGVNGAPLRLASFAFGVVRRPRNPDGDRPRDVIHVYWGTVRQAEPVTTLEDIVTIARDLCEQQAAAEAAKAAEQAERAASQAREAERRAREDALRDVARAEQEEAVAVQLETWATTLYAYAQELAAVHRHNRPLLEAIAAKYNHMAFTIEPVEIGVIATDDGLTWANTETRNTLGKTKDGWWLELQQYGADRVILKRYTHIAATWLPITRTPLDDSRYARPVDVVIPNYKRGNEITWNTRIYPELWIAPMVDANEVHATVAATNLLPEPDYPEPPSHNYNHHNQLRQIKQQAKTLYYAAMNIAPPAPEEDIDVPF